MSPKTTNLKIVKDGSKKENSKVSALSPREIVSELDRYVIGQKQAKRAVAVALRNRWRRQALSDEMKDEVLPKNILMIGPTGVGKTEISRRLSKLAQAPFIKVEATRFTEVGYVGRDVEQIIRDLIEIAIAMEREKKRKEVHAKAQLSAEEKVLDALVGKKASLATRESFRKRLRSGDLDTNEIEIEVSDASPGMPSFEIPGMPGANIGMVNLGEMLGKSMGPKGKKKKMSVKESHEILIAQESDKMIEQDKIIKEAKASTEKFKKARKPNLNLWTMGFMGEEVLFKDGTTKAKVIYDGWIEPEAYKPDHGKVSLTSYTKELLSLPSDARPNIKPYWTLNGKTLSELYDEWEDAGFPNRSEKIN